MILLLKSNIVWLSIVTGFKMMFNGLVMFGDSDTSDFTKESGASSGSGGVCDAARAQYYHTKLLSTLQILQNKEDTVRVQTQSLNVAEQRIATLTIRAAQLRRELDRKNSELQKLRKSTNTSGEVDKADVCIQVQELETQQSLVKSLQNNLSVIEDLYRECFYETAKQEELIDMLRKSYLDVRLMEKEKTDHIGRLETVINNQKWSLERCQNIAVEVEDLKLEISNFLSNSNNDSGMWERSEASDTLATEVGEDLQDIMEQLMRLRDMLATDCTCGLKEENKMLKEINDNVNLEMGDLKQRASELQSAVCEKNKDCKQLRKALDERGDELASLRQKLAKLEEGEQDRANMCDCLALQLKQTQVILKEKCEELEQLQKKNAQYAETEAELRKQLAQAEDNMKENNAVRGEVQCLGQQVAQWRQQLADSEARVRCVEEQLSTARRHCANMDMCYREKASSSAALQRELEAAHARGAELCEETRRVVTAVRSWVRRMRERDREQEEKIKEQDAILTCLEKRLQERDDEVCYKARQIDTKDTSPRQPLCSKCTKNTKDTSPRQPLCSKCTKKPEKERIGCSKCTKNPQEISIGCSKCAQNPQDISIGCSKCAKKTQDTGTGCPKSPKNHQDKRIKCSKCAKYEEPSCSKSLRDKSGNETATFRCCASEKASCIYGSGSERASFSSAPIRLRRVLKKKASNMRCSAEVSIQEPQRSEAATCCPLYHKRSSIVMSPTRPLSPSEELFERVERLQEAAEDAQRRWSRSKIRR